MMTLYDQDILGLPPLSGGPVRHASSGTGLWLRDCGRISSELGYGDGIHGY